VVFARGCLSDNGLYVVSLRGEVLVKRLEFDQVHNRMSIISENPNYRPIVVDADDEGASILGKVVGWIHCHPY
jgi:SOS-response transcriptional repressor LexA